MELLFLSKTMGPRLQYSLQTVLKEILGLSFSITDSSEHFLNYEGPKINYTATALATPECWIPPHPILQEQGIQQQSIHIQLEADLPYFFENEQSEALLPFDPFALSFYLLSRYEEYTSSEQDAYGRFPAIASLAHLHNFLHLPLVNCWARVLAKHLQKQFPGIKTRKSKYQFIPTYDIDLAWAHLHKGLWRNLSRFGKEVFQAKAQELLDHLLVTFGIRKDPFFVFPELVQIFEATSIQPIFFFLLGDLGKFDRNISHKRPALQELIQHLSNQYEIGIHPSFASNSKPDQLKKEINRLQNIKDSKVSKSRQHFLMLRLPDTYQRLLEAGITEDYSMGYAALAGFRASIAQPFHWYDLKQEKATNLRIYPFQIMDVTLQQYLQLEPEAAFQESVALINTCKKYGGTFSLYLAQQLLLESPRLARLDSPTPTNH